MTQQIIDEFARNREAKLAQALRDFKKIDIQRKLPRFFAESPHRSEFLKAWETIADLRTKMADESLALAAKRSLPVELFVRDLIDAVEIHEITEDVFARAERRAKLRNPPGKNDDGLGDQINWEILLAGVPAKTDLHIVSRDSDYSSSLHDNMPHEFISREYRSMNGGTLHLHDELNRFLDRISPAKSRRGSRTRELVTDLVDSRSFKNTKLAIAALLPLIEELSLDEVVEILKAASENYQIYWILNDYVVSDFIRQIRDVFGVWIDEDLFPKNAGSEG